VRYDRSPSQAKGLTGGGDLPEAKVDVPLYVSHTCVWSHSWALWQKL